MAQVNVRDRNKNKPDKKPNWEYRFEGAKIDGKRKLISKSGFRTKKEALEAGNKALTEYNSGGRAVHPSSISFSDYLDLWMENYVEVNLRHKTILSYRGIINNHLKPKLGHFKLVSLTPEILQGFANNLKKQGYSKRHVINILSQITTALNYAVTNLKYIQHNPMSGVILPKIEKAPKKRIVLSLENWDEMKKLIDETKSKLQKAMRITLTLKVIIAFASISAVGAWLRDHGHKETWATILVFAEVADMLFDTFPYFRQRTDLPPKKVHMEHVEIELKNDMLQFERGDISEQEALRRYFAHRKTWLKILT